MSKKKQPAKAVTIAACHQSRRRQRGVEDLGFAYGPLWSEKLREKEKAEVTDAGEWAEEYERLRAEQEAKELMAA